MNSSSPESTYSSSQVAEHRNDSEVNFLDGTVDERDTNSPTLSLSFETTATDKIGGCGLFINQVSNRFDTDISDRSTVISDMVDNIEEELHERFFARSQSDDSESVDSDYEDTYSRGQDTVEEDDRQDMPSVTSTTVSSKASTIRQSKSLDTTDNTTGPEEEKEQSIKVKEERQQDTFVSVEEDVEESQAKNGSWFGEFFSSNAIVNVNVDESAKENEEEEEEPVEEADKPIQR